MSDLFKNNQKIIGSIIKLNRIKQNISQKNLAKGICVPSYLSRIESGELLPSDDVMSIIFKRLGLEFNDSEDFIKNATNSFDLFFDNLNFNEFDFTTKLFNDIEKKEAKFITSPLILDYFLAKLARYCSTPIRENFKSSKLYLESAFDLLSEKQKAKYHFYVAVDILNLNGNIKTGKDYLKKSLSYKDTGHCYYWLSYVYRLENNTIKAYDCIKKALDLYVKDGNFISIMNSYEKIAEVYFLLDNYIDAITHLKKALRMASTIKNKHYIEHVNSIIAWSLFRLKDYTNALKCIQKNSGIADHRLLIPDKLLECLIHFTLKDNTKLKKSLAKLHNPQTLEQMDETLIDMFSKLFNFCLLNHDYIKNPNLEILLLDINNNISRFVELKKVFTELLKEYYIQNRRYKDALLL
ncbi:helix-turn-helix transcriptional regulator [uncultured Clostridium sp.]|uniref:helix-turn-helix transcriptional regulator n=1 Tax=uncultured Clostridium sp. TaxID=59620 RepID=UPI00261D0978|nr:helix-turn-helix transcriptional regulator [uncultured Clostridium sp.]